MAKNTGNGGGTPNPRANMSAADNRTARKAAALRKRANAGGRTEHNQFDLNRGKHARFVAWAKDNPIEACKQAQELFDKTQDDWKLELVRKHHIGDYVVRSKPGQPRKSTVTTPAPKRTYALPNSPAKIAELETAHGAAVTDLAIAKFNKRGVAKAIKALADAKRALDKAVAANDRVSEKMVA